MNYQRHLLLLPLQSLLALLIFLSLASAQNSSDTSDFVLTVQETLLSCENAELSWSGSNTLPLYEVYLASGQGAVGDNDSLDAEQWLGAVNDTAFEWLVEPPGANTGDVLRFRVEDKNGTGISAIAWSTVTGSSCTGTETPTTIHLGPTSHIHQGPTTVIVSIHTTGDVTTKNTNVQTQTADLITMTGTAAAVTSDIPTQGPSASSPSPGNSDQSGPASPTGSPGLNSQANSSGQDPSQVASGDFSKTGDGTTANQPQGTRSGQQGSQSTRTAAPVEVNSDDTSSPKGGPLSAQAIGAIVGTVCIATALWLCFMLWRRRIKRRAVAVVPRERESPYTGSTRELLPSSSEASPNSLQGRTMATAQIYPQTQMLTVPPPPASGYVGATVSSYDEATSPYSPLGTPDPFRNNIPLPGNSRSQPGLS